MPLGKLVAFLGVFLSLCCLGVSNGAGEEKKSKSSVASGESIRLQFRDQSWPSVLEWYAELSQTNIDWQTLPEETLNLVTRESYAVPEVHDLINMHLLMRGYTMLQRGEILTVIPLEALNVALVPRVEPDDLAGRQSHEFVRVTFPLRWLIAEQVAKEFKPLLSRHGSITPLSTTNSIEVVDAVSNLQQLHNILDREQSEKGTERLVVEFRLTHAGADDVMDKLHELLGTSVERRMRSSDRARMRLEVSKAKAETLKKFGAEATGLISGEAKIHLVVNEEANSIIVNAPPDKVELVRQAIAILDRPREEETSPWEAANRLKVYHLRGVELDSVREIVDEMRELGTLERETRVELDDRNDTLIVHATPKDQLVIANVVRQFEPEPRKAHIIDLATLDPVYAVKAVRLTLRDLFDRRARGGMSSLVDNDEVRIEPDPDHRRVLLWATDAEQVRVREFLTQLGEVDTTQESAAPPLRVLDIGRAEFDDIARKIQELWPRVQPNPINISPGADQRQLRRESPSTTEQDKSTRYRRNPVRTQLVSTGGKGKTEPAVTVAKGTEGKIVISSRDQQAITAMESLVREMLPTDEDVTVFRLKHANSYLMQIQLEEVFLDEVERSRRDDNGESLVKRESQIRFFADASTGSLLVKNASPDQLRRIETLIELFDRPERVDQDVSRVVRTVVLKHAVAEEAAEIVKDVYRDLLSETDRDFARERGDEGRRNLGYLGLADSKRPRYRGLLSVGVNEAANSLIISTPRYFADEVEQLVHKLDRESAESVTVQVVPLGTVSSTQLRGFMTNVLGVEVAEGDEDREDRRRRERREQRRRRERDDD